MYYDWDGRAVDRAEFAKLFNKDRKVARDVVGDLTVSTVFLGLDHRFDGNGPPLIYETMVFPKGSYGELYCDRYGTKDEALAGHEKAVAMAKAGDFDDNAKP